MKAFYQGLKAVYGPRDSGCVPVRSHDGLALITDHAGILSRWAEHFQGVLNQSLVQATPFSVKVTQQVKSAMEELGLPFAHHY